MRVNLQSSTAPQNPTTEPPGHSKAAGSGATRGGQTTPPGYSGRSSFVKLAESPSQSAGGLLGGMSDIQNEEQLGKAIDEDPNYGNHDGNLTKDEVEKFIYACNQKMMKDPGDKVTENLKMMAEKLKGRMNQNGNTSIAV